MVNMVRNREAMREATAQPGEEWGRQADHTAELGTANSRHGNSKAGKRGHRGGAHQLGKYIPNPSQGPDPPSVISVIQEAQ